MHLIPGWHPLIVHFPLALCATGAVCLSAARLLRSPRHAATLAIVGTWNLCGGAVALFFALGSGLAAVIGLTVGAAAHAAIAAHVKAALLTTLVMLLAGLWRGLGVAQDSRPTGGFLLVVWLATAALVVTGYRGAQNVYRYGVGVAVTQTAP